MNSDLYIDEFRNFKYLKSNPATVRFYKESASRINSVQPWRDLRDPNYQWPYRVEFLEQVFDLRNNSIYIVDEFLEMSNTPAAIYNNRHGECTLIEINNPVIYKGNPVQPHLGIYADATDVIDIENFPADYILCSRKHYFTPEDRLSGHAIKVSASPLVPHSGYSAVFYNKEYAEKYRCALSEAIRKNNDAVSAISILL